LPKKVIDEIVELYLFLDIEIAFKKFFSQSIFKNKEIIHEIY
jgi:hypothetical protein